VAFLCEWLIVYFQIVNLIDCRGHPASMASNIITQNTHTHKTIPNNCFKEKVLGKLTRSLHMTHICGSSIYEYIH